jgi:uncharacterized protein YoxC
MSVTETLDLVLVIVAIVLAGLGIWAVFVLMRTLRDAQSAIDDVRARLVPLLDKADVTVDALNAELLRLDGIVTQVEEVSGVVTAAGEFMRSPVHKVAEGAVRLTRAFRKR